ncbi:hypothetical protein [Sporomusa acidovorans]|uniref:Uncharacterized protein n=1 Tax=Sporomusa acidovorans (strain ATCC 49682 / DSM 3132 / Mol) TaxID=1123286 RepID=A0ABZ3J413_SPOA4|nr:hypothetical protein [Sporomusa acidovorans]OZC15487.1 hypothetical protein SPACI_47910 [Sporomusa acidovorans DSM 3132]SDE15972.1 hypothetical protein SAMN04488499_100917 [Sporomusa acidovorans]
MKKKILVTFFSILVFMMMMISSVGAANGNGQETNLIQMKADAQRVEKLRYGYITYERNKVIYYW